MVHSLDNCSNKIYINTQSQSLYNLDIAQNVENLQHHQHLCR